MVHFNNKEVGGKGEKDASKEHKNMKVAISWVVDVDTLNQVVLDQIGNVEEEERQEKSPENVGHDMRVLEVDDGLN